MGTALRVAVDVPAGVEATWQALTGPAWPVALDEQLHDGSRLVTREPDDGGGLVLVVSRRLPEGGPSVVRRLAPRDGRVLQTESWAPPRDGSRQAAWSVAFPASPGSLTGTMAVEPTPSGSRWSVHGELAIHLPLVGGRAEGFLAPLVEGLVVRQGEVLRRLLAA